MSVFDNDRTRFGYAIRFAQVRSAKRERACRAKYLPLELFAEPAWDILLELYSFNLVGRSPSEAQLTEKLAVPTTTSMRWLKVLEAHYLLSRAPCPEGIQLQLTPRALAAMDAYFADQN